MATTFSTLYTAVANRVRIPTSNTTELAKIKAIVNQVYRDILFHEDWYWLVKRTVINTASAFDHGTITIVSGSTEFTLSNVATSLGSFVGRKLLLPTAGPDSLAVYRIATHTADLATGNLDSEFTQDSVTSTAFHVYKDEYDLPTDFLSFVDMQRFGFPLAAKSVGPFDMLQMKGSDTRVGRPQRYTVNDFDTTGDPTTQRQLWVHPYPDHTYRMEIYYRRQAADMSGDSDVPAMPNEFRDILVDGALAIAYPAMLADESRGQMFRQRYEQGLARMAAQNREKTGQKPSIQPLDQHRGWVKRRRISAGTMDLGSWFDRIGRDG